MSVVIRGGTSNLNAETRAGINADNALVTSPEATKARAGFAGAMGIVDDGTVVAGGLRREIDVSADYRQRVGIDTCLWSDVFQYTNINASAYAVVTSTMTITQASGTLNLNAGAAVATGNHVVLRTWRTFPLFNSVPLYCYFGAIGTNQIAQNAIVEVGLGYALTTAAPTDGVFFRWNIDGELRGVVVNNSVEAQTGVLAQVADSVRGEYLIIINDENVEFWIDGVLRGVVDAVATWTGMGPVQSTALPFLARCYNSGTATAAKRLNITEINVTMGDLGSNRMWSTQMAGMELAAVQSPPGAAASQLANYANSAAPASATLSNTTAGYTTLGGQFQFAAVAGAETDYALFAYQVPAGSVTQPGKNLVIRGIWIDTYNTGAAVATTPHLLQWALGVGSSAVSLATTDSLTAAGRAPRRLALGSQSFPVGAAIGANADRRIDVNLDAPIVVAAGTFVHVILKMPVATATASQVVRGVVGFNAFFE